MFYENQYRIKSSRDMDKDPFSQQIRIPITGKYVKNALILIFFMLFNLRYIYLPSLLPLIVSKSDM